MPDLSRFRSQPGNFDAALKAEMKAVVRCFQRYTSEQVSDLMARVGRPSRDALNRGHFYYTHPKAPGIAFGKRSQAARHVLDLES